MISFLFFLTLEMEHVAKAAQKKFLVLRPRPPLFFRFPEKKFYFPFFFILNFVTQSFTLNPKTNV